VLRRPAARHDGDADARGHGVGGSVGAMD
jgi:hypothetical protein